MQEQSMGTHGVESPTRNAHAHVLRKNINNKYHKNNIKCPNLKVLVCQPLFLECTFGGLLILQE